MIHAIGWKRVDAGEGGASRRFLGVLADESARAIVTALIERGIEVEVVEAPALGHCLAAAKEGAREANVLFVAGSEADLETGALALVPVLAAITSATAAKLVVVTRDADRLPSSAAISALAATFAREQNISVVRADLSDRVSSADFDRLADLLRAVAPRASVAIRGGELSERHLAPIAPAAIAPCAPEKWELSAAGKRGFALLAPSFAIREVAKSRVCPGEVQVEVSASSLDPFTGIPGAVDELDGTIGWGCVGRVVALGEGVVGGLKVGQRVIALAPGSASRFITVHGGLVAPLPEDLNANTAAATLPSIALAMHALSGVARVAAGDHVLVLDAATPLGLATIEAAKRLGATVTAESPSEEGRAWLKARAIPRALDSKKSSFVNDLLQVPRGNRVNVIVAPGRCAPPDLQRFAAAGAHYIQIAHKRPENIRLEPGIAFTWVEPHALMQKQPQVCASLLRAAITSRSSFTFSEEKVFTFEDAENFVIAPGLPPSSRVRADGTYVVAGGTGALGLEAAKWLVRKGAASIVLLARNEPSVDAKIVMNFMHRAGAKVVWKQADLSKEADVDAALAEVRAEGSLRGVVVASGANVDVAAAELDRPTLARAFGAKTLGAMNLLRATAGDALEFFVVCSSIGRACGLPGRSASAAADAALAVMLPERAPSGCPVIDVSLAPFDDHFPGETASDAISALLESETRAGSILPFASEVALDSLAIALPKATEGKEEEEAPKPVVQAHTGPGHRRLPVAT